MRFMDRKTTGIDSFRRGETASQTNYIFEQSRCGNVGKEKKWWQQTDASLQLMIPQLSLYLFPMFY
jgi:hypothetical protein